MTRFQPATQAAWCPIRDEFFSNDGAWMEPADAAWLMALLKLCPDSKELFPHGKWASIQFLEQLVEDDALVALDSALFNQPPVGAIKKGL